MLLGPEMWSRVIRIENEARPGRYPRTLHALVFELAGILWFYTDTDGTQSFSLHAGRLAEEKADFSPLLRDIEPGFVRWRVVPAGDLPSRSAAGRTLRNGCFIESVAALLKRRARGEPLERPRLLSFYAHTHAGRLGHTVLAYGHGDVVEIFDPARPEMRPVFAKTLGHEALALARALDGSDVVQARFVELDLGALAMPISVAAAERTPVRDGAGSTADG